VCFVSSVEAVVFSWHVTYAQVLHCTNFVVRRRLDYVAVLRKLAKHCDFGDRLADDLRDRLVCGMRHENIQKKLLSEAGLTLKKAIEISVAMETAAKDAALHAFLMCPFLLHL
jgi:hypothetical protein